MHKIVNTLSIAFLLIGLSACHQGSNHYTIQGQMHETGFDGATVYMTELDGRQPLDSAVIANGLFRFEGEADTLTMVRLVTSVSNKTFSSLLILEPGTITINLVNDSLSGTPTNDRYYRYFTCDTVAQDIQARMMGLVERYYQASTPDEQASIMQEYYPLDSLLSAHTMTHCQEVFDQNRDNFIGAYALWRMAEEDKLTYEQLDSIMSRSSTAITSFKPLTGTRSKLFHVANTSEGKPFVDIDGIDYATGQPTTLSAMLDPSQVTLIDFWASWCGPCRKEISENLVRLYDKYHAQGLNIIGVDVWDKMPDHQNAVEQLHINYPQLIDTTRTATENYGIVGIPTILLLDQQGTIIERGLRGDDIEDAVIHALKNLRK